MSSPLRNKHGERSFTNDIEVTEGDEICGQTVGSLVARGIHPLAISHGPREYETNPAPDRTLVAGDHRIISGTAATIGGPRAGH